MIRIVERIELNVFHIDQICADLFRHDDAVADDRRRVRRFTDSSSVSLTLVVMFAHFDVRAEAAGRQNNAAVGGKSSRV